MIVGAFTSSISQCSLFFCQWFSLDLFQIRWHLCTTLPSTPIPNVLSRSSCHAAWTLWQPLNQWDLVVEGYALLLPTMLVLEYIWNDHHHNDATVFPRYFYNFSGFLAFEITFQIFLHCLYRLFQQTFCSIELRSTTFHVSLFCDINHQNFHNENWMSWDIDFSWCY